MLNAQPGCSRCPHQAENPVRPGLVTAEAQALSPAQNRRPLPGSGLLWVSTGAGSSGGRGSPALGPVAGVLGRDGAPCKDDGGASFRVKYYKKPFVLKRPPSLLPTFCPRSHGIYSEYDFVPDFALFSLHPSSLMCVYAHITGIFILFCVYI